MLLREEEEDNIAIVLLCNVCCISSWKVVFKSPMILFKMIGGLYTISKARRAIGTLYFNSYVVLFCEFPRDVF